ncbi:MAG: hypothetical protein EOP84_17565 [Verrucomicrobiaceae bacterium]|nr:MAG: hypothetical protein EOP84_17565 [Verrucomicrobiaceae bacterium]
MRVPSLFNDRYEALRFLGWARTELLKADKDAAEVMAGRDEVLDHFGPVFRKPQAHLTPKEMASFLDFGNNHHWTQLHRQ